MKIDGQCHCGAVTYEAEIDPEAVEICNCTDCQTLSGSAFRVVVPAHNGQFRLLSGNLKRYIKTTAESGTHRAQMFCPECGTSIYSSLANGDPPYYIRLPTARQRDELPPQKQYWTRSAQRWHSTLVAIPKIEKQQLRRSPKRTPTAFAGYGRRPCFLWS